MKQNSNENSSAKRFSFMESNWSLKQARWKPSSHPINQSVQDWFHFCDMLGEMHMTPAMSKDRSELISPAFYDGELYRKNVNVSGWGFLALDVDTPADDPYYLTMESMAAFLQQQDWNHVVYNSPSSQPHHHKFRVLIETREIARTEIAATKASFDQMIPFGDRSCKDLCRAYYRPGIYPDAHAGFFYKHDGIPLDVDWMIRTFSSPNVISKMLSHQQVEDRMQHMQRELAKRKCRFNLDDMITDNMRREFITACEGGRLFRLMVSIAKRALWFGYPITAQDIESLSLTFDVTATGKDRPNTLHEAANALAFAVSTHNTEKAQVAYIANLNKSKKERTRYV